DDQDSEQGARRATAATGLRAEGNRDQGKDKTGDGEGEALVQFHAGIAPAFAAVMPQLPQRALGVGGLALFWGADAADLDGPVAAAECGDAVAVGFFPDKFVRRTSVEVQLQLALLWLRNYN